MEPQTVSEAVPEPLAAGRPRACGGRGGTGRAPGPRADQTDQLTQRIIGASRSTSYGLLQAHERALREIADTLGADDREWIQAVAGSYARLLDRLTAGAGA